MVQNLTSDSIVHTKEKQEPSIILNCYQDSHTDTKNKIVTSPAFMCDASFYEIFDSVGKMVEGVMKLLK